MTNLCKTAFAILASLAISGTALSGEPLSKDTAVAPAAQPTGEATTQGICPSSQHQGHPCSISPEDLACRAYQTHGSHLKGQLC
jgi:hypothetical protein